MSIRVCLVLALFSPAWSQPITVLSWNVHGGREAFPGWFACRGGSNRELLILSRSPFRVKREVKLGRGRPCLRVGASTTFSSAGNSDPAKVE